MPPHYLRLTVYSKIDISTKYPIQVCFSEINVHLWENPTKIKVISNWRVSIEPYVLNQLSLMLRKQISISTKYNEYHSLMKYLTKTGITLLDLIDFRDAVFFDQLNSIYNIRFSYAERIQATRLMKVKNNSNLLTQCPNGKQRLIRFSLNCLNFLP